MRITSRNFQPASSSRTLIPVTSRWLTSSTLDLLKGCRMTLFVGSTSLKSVPNGVLGDHSASIRWWRPLQKPTWRPATNSKRYRTHLQRQLIPSILRSQDPCLLWFRELPPLQRFLQILCQHHTSTPCRPEAMAPMASTVPEPMNLDTIAKRQEELHAYIGERPSERFGRQDGRETRRCYNCGEQVQESFIVISTLWVCCASPAACCWCRVSCCLFLMRKMFYLLKYNQFRISQARDKQVEDEQDQSMKSCSHKELDKGSYQQ